MVLLLLACGTQGPEGPPGPEGPEGPEGLEGPQGLPGIDGTATVAYHWRDATDAVVFPSPEMVRFDGDGVRWTYGVLQDSFAPGDQRGTYWTEPECAGTGYITNLRVSGIPVRVDGVDLMVPVDAQNPTAFSVQSYRTYDGTCLPQGGDDVGMRIVDLVPVGTPPDVDWTGLLHPVPGSP